MKLIKYLKQWYFFIPFFTFQRTFFSVSKIIGLLSHDWLEKLYLWDFKKDFNIPNVKEKFMSSCTSLKEYLDKVEREKRGINWKL